MTPRTLALTALPWLWVASRTAGQNNDWLGNSSSDWFDGTNWSATPPHPPTEMEDARHLSNSPGSADIVINSGTSARAKTFEGQLDSDLPILSRSMTIGSPTTVSGSLLTEGNMFRTGANSTKYKIILSRNAQLSVGNENITTDNGEFYGFTLDLQGADFNAFARIKTEMGYGPVQLLEAGLQQAASTSDSTITPPSAV